MDAATPRERGHRPEPSRDRPRARLARTAGLVSAAAVGAVLVALGAGTVPPSGTDLFTMLTSYAWTAVGPDLVVLGFLALALAVIAVVRGRRRFGAVAALLALVGTVWSGAIVGSILQASDAAGGHIDLLSALVPGSMDAPNDGSRVYETVGATELSATIYRPSRAAGAAPVLVYIHGGGWITGAAQDLGHDRRWFADHGWLVVSVDYRLATADRATWDEAPQDVACALVWTQRNAAALGGDPHRLVVSGDSAGGNLAVNVADGAALGRATSGCGGTVPVPEAVVVQYPVADPQNAYDYGFPSPGFEPKTFTADYLGGTPQAHPDRMAAISSATYVSSKAPPTLVIEPARDGLIPTAGVEDWIRSAKRAGAPVSTVSIPYANHTYNQLASSSIGDQAGLTIAEAYLARLGIAP